MISKIRASLSASYDAKLADELLAAYDETKRNFYLGNLRPSEVEAGRFCEAAFRMLEERTSKTFTPLGKTLDTDKIIRDLGNLLATAQPDAIRLHIPRALRVVYDIRNKRDAAHLADGIDPNLQDATLVVSVLDWVLAEFLRLHHSVPANEAQFLVENLVSRRAPVIENFNGFLKVLNPKLNSGDHLLLVLYERGKTGATFDELNAWARPKMRMNLRRTLSQLENRKAYLHHDSTRYFITRAGMQEVEQRRLFEINMENGR